MASPPESRFLRSPRRPTRRAVAELAGVAESTVSAVLNGRGDEFRLAAATQQRVLDAARALNYVPSAAARALATRRSRIIGLAVSGPQLRPRTPVVADVTLAAVEQARELGHFVLQLPAPEAAADDLITPIRDAGIAGLVCSVWESPVRLGEQLVAAGFPVVWVEPNGRGDPRPGGPLVGIDPERGVTQLADRLWATGRRSVAILIREAADQASTKARIQPLLSRFGPTARTVPIGGWSIAAGREAMAGILATGDPPDAVFGMNDQIACGALHACRAAGLGVPEDIAVAGYGDFPEAEATEPALTTVSWPLLDLGRVAVRTLIRSIEAGEPVDDQHLTLPTTLVRRSSA